jgi:hypothetical protein
VEDYFVLSVFGDRDNRMLSGHVGIEDPDIGDRVSADRRATWTEGVQRSGIRPADNS